MEAEEFPNEAAILQACVGSFEVPSNSPKSQAAKIHKYWSRKPEQVLRRLISSFSSLDDVVLDPFCGSGAIGLEALMAGRSFIGFDLNPMAVRVSRDTLSPDFDAAQFDAAFGVLERRVSQKLSALFTTSRGTAAYLMPNSKSGANAVLLQPSGKKLRARINLKELPSVRLSSLESQQLPTIEFPQEFYKDRFSYKGVKRVTDLFSRRVLKCLAILSSEIKTLDGDIRPMFELCFTNTLLHVSKLKSEQVRPLGVNNYWIPDDFIEENVWWRFSDRCRQYRKAKLVLKSDFQALKLQNVDASVAIGDAQCLSGLEDGSVGYVLTDPPYGDAIQYSELSYVWNSWLGETFDISSEIVVNPCQRKNIDTYVDMLDKSFAEIHRVLKIGGFLTLAFQNKDLILWYRVADRLRARGFKFQDIFADRMLGSPFTKNWAEFSPKSDLYLTLRKSVNAAGQLGSRKFSEIFYDAKRVARENNLTPDRSYDYLAMRIVCDSLAGRTITFDQRPEMSRVMESLAL